MRSWLCGLLIAAAVLIGADEALAGEHYALIVTGVSAGPKYAANYDRWRTRLVSALEGRLGFPASHLAVLAEHATTLVDVASREHVRQAIARFGAAMQPGDLLLVVLIGHGSFDGDSAKFNLVGPDLDGVEWADLLHGLPGRLVFVDTTSSSAPFLQKLAGKNRVVVTATDSAAERFETVFPEFFVKALEGTDADVDKDGRLSMWEIFTSASLAVRRWYQQRGQLPTERALLDDLGDGIGKDADAPGVDSRTASQVYLDVAAEASAGGGSSLERRRDALLAEVSRLKARKTVMAADEYSRELETVLVELARLSRQIRQ